MFSSAQRREDAGKLEVRKSPGQNPLVPASRSTQGAVSRSSQPADDGARRSEDVPPSGVEPFLSTPDYRTLARTFWLKKKVSPPQGDGGGQGSLNNIYIYMSLETSVRDNRSVGACYSSIIHPQDRAPKTRTKKRKKPTRFGPIPDLVRYRRTTDPE